MPLDIIGSYAASGSNGAIARNAARSNEKSSAATNGFAAPSSRRGTSGGEEIDISKSSVAAVYVSPYIRLDIKTRLAIVEIRNSQTGEVQQQYPSPRVVREYAQNLPDNSDLRTDNQDSGSEQNSGDATAPPIIGSNPDQSATKPQPVTFGQDSNPAPSPAPAASGIARAAAAAFSGIQNTLVGARELAVA